MMLTETQRDRLDDVRELEPTTNGELRDRWGMDSGSDVHRYLESELSEHVTRGDDGKIRVDGEPAQVDSEPTQGSVGDHSGDSKPEEDHSPSGTNGGPESPPTAGRDDHSGDVSTAGTTAIMEEEQDMIDAAAEAGRQDGYADGFDDAVQSVEGGRAESATTSATATATGDACTDCGGKMYPATAGELFLEANGETMILEGEDRICADRHAVVGADGTTHYGVESSEGSIPPDCANCGESTASVEHALGILGIHREQKSALRVRSRRRLTKIGQRIARSDADHVCVGCWTAY